jgi:hypothetical protein
LQAARVIDAKQMISEYILVFMGFVDISENLSIVNAIDLPRDSLRAG